MLFAKSDVCAIVAAGGNGSRMGSDIPKQFIEIDGIPILAHTVKTISECPEICGIILAVPEDYVVFCTDFVRELGLKKVTKIISGGETRQKSVFNALADADAAYIAVFDGARPLVKRNDISRCIADARKHGAAALGCKASDTLKRENGGFIAQTVEREGLWQIQTPQIFAAEIILKAHNSAVEDNFGATDDCALVERLGQKIKITEGARTNIKITTPEDLAVAEALLCE